MELARRVVSGDRDALAHLYDRHADAMFSTAVRYLRSSHDAEDVVQSVFQSLPKTLRTFEGRGTLAGWLGQVTARAALMLLRDAKRRSEVSLDGVFSEFLTMTGGDPEARITLERAILRLPDQLRLVYLMKEVEGFTHGETAILLSISEQASRVRLHRARKQLRDFLR